MRLVRNDWIRWINSEIAVIHGVSKLLKRKPSLLSSIKKHFKCISDTSFHYSLQPATSSTELSARPKSTSRYWLSDWLVMSSESPTYMHTKEIYTHTPLRHTHSLAGTRSDKFEGEGRTLNSLSCCSDHLWTISALWQREILCRQKPLLSGNTMKCTWSVTLFRFFPTCSKLWCSGYDQHQSTRRWFEDAVT